MNNNVFSLTPLMRSTVGFDRFNDIFENVFNNGETTKNYPPYNIEKHGENEYQISMAVAGFKESDISITAEGNTLTVTGKTEQKEEKEDVQYLYKGIANRSFENKFSIADNVKVKGASLADGLLHIKLEREIPEAKKPKLIPINGK